MMREQSRVRAWFLSYGVVLLAVLMWSTSEILQKLLQNTVPPISKSFLRFVIGMLPLMIILLLKRDFNLGGFWRRYWKHLILAGVIGFGIGNVVYFLGVIRTQANVGSAIYGSYPIFISLYSIFWVKENRNLPRRFFGYFLGFLGILILVVQGNWGTLVAADYIVGNLLVLAGAAIWSIFSVIGKWIANDAHGEISNVELKFNFLAMVLAGVTNFLILLWIPNERITLFGYPAVSWIYLLILGVVTTGIGTWLFFLGIKQIPVSQGIALANFKPVFVAGFAFLILHEALTIGLWIGIPLIFCATYFVTTNPTSNTKSKREERISPK